MATMTYTGTLKITSCWCGIHLAIPSDLYDIAVRQGKSVYCPVGHTFVYGDTVREQLEEARQQIAQERRRAQATRDLLHAEERSHAATRGHLTRQRRRAVAGVCPVQGCKRHFEDLDRHMKSKHPGYPDEPERPKRSQRRSRS